MKKSRFFLIAGLLAAGGCSLTHYDSLDQTPQTEILISSNVPAQLWIDGRKVQDKAKEHILKQTGMEVVTLVADGFRDARVIVYRNLPEKKNVTSHQSSLSWTSRKVGDLSSDLSEMGADAATTSPTSTVMFPVNLVKFAVELVALPFTYTVDFNPFGYYLAYGKNQFYVEMMPKDASGLSTFDAFKLRVKDFVLKNYPALAEGEREYVVALSRFTGLTTDEIESVLSEAKSPAEGADEIVAVMKPAK